MFAGIAAFLQKILDAVVIALNALFSLFPDSPFAYLANTSFGSLLNDINYFLPVYEFVIIGEAWLVCVAVYYIYVVWARWVKAIE